MSNQDYKFSSSGFDTLQVFTALSGRLKWRSDVGTGDSAQPSKSERYFDDGSFHAIVTEANLKAIQPVAGITAEALTTLKEHRERAVIASVLNDVFAKDALVERGALYEVGNAKPEAVTPDLDSNGFCFCVPEDKTGMVQIENVFLFFDNATDVILELYAEGNPDAIWTQTVAATANKRTTVALNQCFLDAAKHSTDKFYFGYSFATLSEGVKPLQLDAWIETGYAMFFGEAVKAKDSNFYRGEVVFPSKPIGLNVELASFVDYTDRIVHHPQIFDHAIGLTNAVMLLQESLYTSRKNPDERILTEASVRAVSQLDLAGILPTPGSPKTDGLLQDLDKEIKRVRASFYKTKSGVVNDCNQN